MSRQIEINIDQIKRFVTVDKLNREEIAEKLNVSLGFLRKYVFTHPELQNLKTIRKSKNDTIKFVNDAGEDVGVVPVAKEETVSPTVEENNGDDPSFRSSDEAVSEEVGKETSEEEGKEPLEAATEEAVVEPSVAVAESLPTEEATEEVTEKSQDPDTTEESKPSAGITW
jgi:hypothetical protein